MSHDWEIKTADEARQFIKNMEAIGAEFEGFMRDGKMRPPSELSDEELIRAANLMLGFQMDGRPEKTN